MYNPFSTPIEKPEIGLKKLPLDNWIEVGKDFASQMPEKHRLLSQNRDEVAFIDAADNDAAHELEEIVTAHLQEHKIAPNKTPDQFQNEHPLIRISAQVQEDFCLLAPNEPVVLNSSVVCFPSYWRLQDKVGKDILTIHQPVPQFDPIAKATERSLLKMQEKIPLIRFNWTINDSNILFAPERPKLKKEYSSDDILSALYVRIEKQTLRRLPKSQYVVFTIRTFIDPIKTYLKSKSSVQQVKQSLETLSPQLINYRGISLFYDPLMQALEKKVFS